ncbi:structure-specific endonuclease subunit slx1 isoform X1 [Vigna unguiculata]|uniref:structure-specific endonuclease subunit slx1 isoform X1 n=1 Tax=Vigna unguiculata TaxID=3917 RepID=UPI001016C583|nr:structure-specific endonuclease subunit slx1 isoform X1 [Vigna unguiculata]
MMRTLSTQFRSIKCPNPNPKLSKSSSPTKSELKFDAKPKPESESWCVYLILSTNHPIKTYVGITNNFPRRLKQHNGELNGGAKASRAGRPWICACLICGFADRREASIFESKWKAISKRAPRKNKNEHLSEESEDPSLPLLRHRQAALKKVKGSLDCTHLEFIWLLDPS